MVAAKFGSVVVGLMISGSVVVAGSQAHAAKVSKPAAPVIIKVSPIARSGKLVKIRVLIERPLTKVTNTVVRTSMGPSCTIKGSGTSCVISKVNYRWSMSVTAYSYNGRIKGASSSKVRLVATSTWLRDGYDISGVKFPAPTSSPSNGRLLGTASKWTKFQALKRSGVSSAGVRQVRPAVAGTDVVFQVSGAVALALSTASGSCGTNSTGQAGCAVAVAADGSNPSLFAAGSATPSVRDFHSAPNGKFYVVFSSMTILVSGGRYCVFAEVNLDTGIPTCVDEEMSSVSMGMGYSFGSSANGNPTIQFDDAGNVYYSGQANSGSFGFTLRKKVGSTVSTLVNDNITVRDFLVLGDGSILLSGSTTSTQSWWIRKLSPSGAITTLVNGAQANFLRKFADGNIYYGVMATGPGTSSAVYRYLVTDGKVDDMAWIATAWSGAAIASRNDVSVVCQQHVGNTTVWSTFCQLSGAHVKNSFNLGNTTTIAIAGGVGMQSTTLMQYYPTVQKEPTVVQNITLAYQAGSKIVLAGLDAAAKNIITVVDPTTHQEVVIFDGSNEVEVYSIGFVPSTGKVMFNGLSFATGKIIVGDITIP